MKQINNTSFKRRPVGRIDFLGSNGTAGESIEYTDETEFALLLFFSTDTILNTGIYENDFARRKWNGKKKKQFQALCYWCFDSVWILSS